VDEEEGAGADEEAEEGAIDAEEGAIDAEEGAIDAEDGAADGNWQLNARLGSCRSPVVEPSEAMQLSHQLGNMP
jgi:hypothetical protein